MKILFVLNPISGDRDKGAILRTISDRTQEAGIDQFTFVTTGSDDDDKLDWVLDQYRPDRAVAIGGDGTVLFVARHLRSKDVPIAIVPFGSANGLASDLGMDDEPEQAIERALASQETRPLDLIRINDSHYCIHISDIGLNANVVEGYDRADKRGMLTYAKFFVEELRQLETHQFDVEADGETYTWEGYMVAMANARRYGTGAVLNPKGDPGDGVFELVHIHEINWEALLTAGMSTISEDAVRRIEEGRYSDIISCRQAIIRPSNPMTLQIDGEVIGTVDEVKAEIIPSAVQLVV